MKELERTFLCRELPHDISKAERKEVFDCYIPKNSSHPVLRIRKNGEKFCITKKKPLNENVTMFDEETIHVDQEEFNVLSQLNGKKLRKYRYNYPFSKNIVCEIDVFLDDLQGLCLVDFEFENEEALQSFVPPSFCSVEVTDKEYVAGGYLCGKRYENIRLELEELGYKPIYSISP